MKPIPIRQFYVLMIFFSPAGPTPNTVGASEVEKWGFYVLLIFFVLPAGQNRNIIGASEVEIWGLIFQT